MVIWINGAFGAGKTTTAFELHRRLENSFVYDPENVGYFIRKNAPKSFSAGDFQDIPLWRETNAKMLAMICKSYDGVVICPMTLVNPGYFDEIIGSLRRSGIDVRHFILCASRETIHRRLQKRSAGWFRRDTFAIGSIDRCLHSFDNYITEIKVETDGKSVGAVVAEIAEKCGIPLLADRRTAPKRFFDRYFTLLRHIRS